MSSFIKFYTQSLQKNPKTTNAVSTGFLFGLGDIIAQLAFSSPPLSKQHNDVAKTMGKNLANLETHNHKPYDPYRTLRAVAYGSVIFSPIGDKWYKFLQNKVYSPKLSNMTNTLARVAVDQLCFAPLAIPFYFGCITLMEGKTWQEAKLKINENYKTTLLANWSVWPLFQAFNFAVVPVHHRLLAVNTIAIFWNTFLSYRNSIEK
ncbi:hypothetical protein ACO0RG_004640 [Hanseniaspora osmophila]|uniref:Protein SYM1 n=1 Tax=Hanseniaspora osmophila TaxID=56408 RepID=A0A1E5RZV3_9ASCO|nr:Protein SYM1 [Hanseniaspora osmophila]